MMFTLSNLRGSYMFNFNLKITPTLQTCDIYGISSVLLILTLQMI